MNISEKQFVALLETNRFLLNQSIALEAKMTSVVNVNSIMMQGFSQGAITADEVLKLSNEAFHKEYVRLKETYQKQIDHLSGELQGE